MKRVSKLHSVLTGLWSSITTTEAIQYKGLNARLFAALICQCDPVILLLSLHVNNQTNRFATLLEEKKQMTFSCR